MNIAICDDAKQYRVQIVYLLAEYAEQKHLDFTISEFSKAADLLDEAQRINGFDIYILDVMMTEMNGIELGVKLRENGYDGIIIYLTSSADFAIDSYKVDASNYILKPILKDVFVNAIDKILFDISKKKDHYVIVKNKQRCTRISYENILYIDVCNRALCYHLANGDIVESTMLRVPFIDAVAPLMQDKRFLHCSKTLVVNMDNITQVDMEYVIFKDDITAYFSKNVCRDLRTKWSEYWQN
ncbi:MAG: response regulator transcription factor [Lachnospiraceae bacterium]|nr:response regulator transcription factor [Lachnospiraceae bacterium]